MRFATYNQISFIKAICKELNIKFEGHTMKQASYFISIHIDDFYRSKRCKLKPYKKLIEFLKVH